MAAGGLTVCSRSRRSDAPAARWPGADRRTDAELEAAETALRDLVERETVLRGEELERTLARARAETSSRLAEDERKLAEARRNELAQRERRVTGELGEALALVERRVEQRLTEWSADLDRIQQETDDPTPPSWRNASARRSARPSRGSKRRWSSSRPPARTSARSSRSSGRSSSGAAGEAGTAARREVEVHESERRRATARGLRAAAPARARAPGPHRRRGNGGSAPDSSRASPTSSAGRSINSPGSSTGPRTGFRRQPSSSFRPRSRPHGTTPPSGSPRARPGSSPSSRTTRNPCLPSALPRVSDAGAARVDRKLAEIVGHIEQRRDEFLAEFQRRFSDVEAELRSQIRAVGADAEAEREVLEARVLDSDPPARNRGQRGGVEPRRCAVSYVVGHKLRAAGSSRRRRSRSDLMAQITETPQDERAKVESWRLHVLMEAGFSLPLAPRSSAPARQTCIARSIRSGCDHETAARILL